MLTNSSINLTGIISSLIQAGNLPPGFWDFNIETQIPLAAGLGSSASLAVAAASCILVTSTQRATNQGCDLEAINSLAYKAEQLVHGKPSGIDNTVATYGGLLSYKQRTFKHIKE
jgi:mevalonate kinase